MRPVGLADLALALRLYVGRPSWPWLLARAASNPAIAAVTLASARSRRAVWPLPALPSRPPHGTGGIDERTLNARDPVIARRSVRSVSWHVFSHPMAR